MLLQGPKGNDGGQEQVGSNEGGEKQILDSILKAEPADSLIGWEQRETLKMIMRFLAEATEI